MTEMKRKGRGDRMDGGEGDGEDGEVREGGDGEDGEVGKGEEGEGMTGWMERKGAERMERLEREG
jgi:hypothetical protein